MNVCVDTQLGFPFMKPKFFLRALAIALCAVLLLMVNRPTTHHLSHPFRAPDFELLDLNGDQVHLSQFRGKAVVLNFWATWCAPCRREIPWFIEFQREYGPQGLQILGVSMDEGGRDAIALFVRRTGIDYPVLLGDGHVSSLYGGLEVLPTTYYISPHGNIIALVNGVVSKAEVERDIKEALGSSPQN
jgi:cytochrome c biogenesis protein CcmG/thiol:disulfide interchange protein DsbE